MTLAATLPASTYQELVFHLRRALPEPASDSPEDLLRRDHYAIAQVAALVPANAVEANLAATYVANSAYALDCLEQARATTNLDKARQCVAQSASTERVAQGALRSLMGLQAARRKREADNPTADRAAWTEHCALQLMAGGLPKGAAVPAQEPPRPEPAPVIAEPEPPPAPVRDEEPVPDPVAEAEQYAVMYPVRAAQIRRYGRIPPDARFGPPEAYIVNALVTGQTPMLRALDRPDGHSRAA